MKKITMFVEDLSDDYDLVAFYPNNASQYKLKEQIAEQKEYAFKDGMKQVLDFVDKYPAPAAGAKLDFADTGDAYEARYIVPETVEPPKNERIPQEDGTVGAHVKSSIDASDIIVTPDGCIINKRFLPADVLMAAASAVHQYQMEDE